MKQKNFIIDRAGYFVKTIALCFLILTAGSYSFAQYRGAPVQKEKLLRVLRLKQAPTHDIVAVISRNGVNFELTPDLRKELADAGASSAVIDAVLANYRPAAKNVNNYSLNKTRKGASSPAASYNRLLEQAMDSYKTRGNLQDAIRLLGEATRLEPANPAAYQSLAFIFLYGLRDLVQAEKYMIESLKRGGAAEFRVIHEDQEIFTRTCEGSLYISRGKVRFAADNNAHGFNAVKAQVAGIETDTVTTPPGNKRSVYRIVLRGGNENLNFRFAPLSEKKQESEMVKRLFRKS